MKGRLTAYQEPQDEWGRTAFEIITLLWIPFLIWLWFMVQ